MIDIMATAREMALNVPVRDAMTIVQEIIEIKEQKSREAEEFRASALDGAIEIGRRLCELKNKVPVGSWGQYMKEHLDYSERTAQNLMAIYNEYGKKGIPEKMANVSLTNALALIGVRDDVKHELIESGMAEEASVRELKAEIARLNKEREEAQQSFLEQLDEEQAAHRETINQLKAKDDVLKASCEKAAREEMRAQYMSDQLAKVNRMRQAAEEELEELRKAQPTEVVEKDSEETLKRLAVLEARARERRESANVILFRERFAGFTEAYNRCLEQLELIAREDGDSGAAQFRRALGRAAAKMARQMGE